MVEQSTVVSIVVTINTIIIVMAYSLLVQKNEMPVEGRTVLITGASQGMGLEAARLLSSKGANVIIVARNRQKLDEAMKQISAAALKPQVQRFHIIATDVTTASSNDRILEEATRWNSNTPPDIIWANAGASTPMLFLDATPEILKSQMDLNYFAAAFLAQSALRSWLAHPASAVKSKDGREPAEEGRSRHFIMTSSVAAFLSIAGYAPYSPAKAALRSLHDQLASELNLYNGAFSKQSPSPPQIKVHTVFPGTIQSPGLDMENQTKHPATHMLEGGDVPQTAEDAAKAAVGQLEKGRAMVTTQGLMGEVIKGSAWMGSVRDQPVLNTILSWITSLVWLFLSWDWHSKVWKMGEKEGVPKHASVEKS